MKLNKIIFPMTVRIGLCQSYLLNVTPESVQVGYHSSSLQEIIQVTIPFYDLGNAFKFNGTENCLFFLGGGYGTIMVRIRYKI